MALRTQSTINLLHPCASNSNKVVILHPSRRRVSFCKGCFKAKYALSCKVSRKQKGIGTLVPFVCGLKPKLFHSAVASATSEDDITVNGSPYTNSDGELEEMRLKLSQSFQGEDASNDLVQNLHDVARIFELAIEQQSSLTRGPWFAKAWLGIDKNAWLKTLAYQASVHALLKATHGIASRGYGRDLDVNVFVQRSLLRESNLLEKSIREQLLSKDPVACEWFWVQQHPTVVTNFVNLLEKDPRFTAATSVGWEGPSLSLSKASDVSLLMLALHTIASVMKLGSAKVSCPQFSSTLSDLTGKLMNALASLIPIDQVYHFTTEMGLRREFLAHFGPRAAAYRGKNDVGGEEGAFWVDLVQQQLRGAIDKERIWSRLTTYECIEVLERDLAIFGFFVALGRRTQSYVDDNKIDIDDSLASFLSYLVGGSVLFYPQLASVSTYQLFVEVVCEEMEWLPFYPESLTDVGKQENENRNTKVHYVSKMEAVSLALDVCSHWVQNFIKYSVWLEKPSNIKAAKFLSISHSKLEEYRKVWFSSVAVADSKNIAAGRESVWSTGDKMPSKMHTQIDKINLFDKELQNVDEALNKLEGLLKEIHICSSHSDKEHLEAACTDLERIRKLKKEAEFLEASLRAKEVSIQQVDQDIENDYFPSHEPQQSSRKRRSIKLGKETQDESKIKGSKVQSVPWGLRSFLLSRSNSNRSLDGNAKEGEASEQTAKVFEDPGMVSNEIQRFEQLRKELVELEKRVQESADGCLDEKVYQHQDNQALNNYSIEGASDESAKVDEDGNMFSKSIGKLKETGSDVWQGTQLLAMDVAAAMVLLRRVLIGDELTNKEKKTLQRTLSDLASVIPIGFLMLLPVTAVGHAAMLAAIKRYFPGMIPSAYARERLDLLRQLEKVQEMEVNVSNPDEGSAEKSSLKAVHEEL